MQIGSTSTAPLTPLSGPQKAERIPPSATEKKWNVMRLAGLLNMASPKQPQLGGILLAPHMALTLQSPGYESPSTIIDVTHLPRETISGDITPVGLAQQMLEAIGDGEMITLADAVGVLEGPNPGKTTNGPDVIEAYFKRFDGDESGSLSKAELVKAFEYHRKHQDDYGGARLGEDWV